MQYARFREGMRLPYRPASYIFLDRDGLIQSIEHVITKHERFQHIYRQRATNTAVDSFSSSFSTLCEQLKCHVGGILIATGKKQQAEDANLVFIPATSWNKAFSFEHVGQGQQKLHMPEMYAAGFWSNALKLFRINHGLGREQLFPFTPPATPSAWDPFDL